MGEQGMSIDEIYDAKFYEEGYRDNEDQFRRMAHCIHECVNLPQRSSVIDVGCGPAIILDELDLMGYDVCGYDGSKAAIDYARDKFPLIKHDLWVEAIEDNPWQYAKHGVYDLVICTEVAEHLPESLANTLVARLGFYLQTCGYIVFTAAHPGQGGTDHINEQQMFYWLAKFGKRGIALDWDKTEDLRRRLAPLNKIPWMAENAVVLYRP